MGKQTISVLVEGGKATAGPPVGPQLGALGLNVKAIVDEINAKTKELAGMKVPVKIIVDPATKEFEVTVGKPPVAALIKKELGLQKGSGEAGTARVGDLTEEQVKKIAKTKFGSDAESFSNQVKGTCRSMGVTIGQGALTEEEIKAQEQKKKEAVAAAAAAEAEKKEEGEEAKEEGEEKKPEEEKPAEKKDEKQRKK